MKYEDTMKTKNGDFWALFSDRHMINKTGATLTANEQRCFNIICELKREQLQMFKQLLDIIDLKIKHFVDWKDCGRCGTDVVELAKNYAAINILTELKEGLIGNDKRS